MATKRHYIVVLASAALVVTSAAPLAARPAGYDVGVIYWSMAIPGQVAMRRGLEQEAERLSRAHPQAPVRLMSFVGGEGDAGVDRQRRAMSTLLARKPDAVILQPIDSAALASAVKAANKAGVPVVAFDQYPVAGHLACYVSSNNRLAGKLDGEYLAYRFRDRTAAHPLRLVLVEYPYVSSTIERVEGLRDALAKAGVPYRIVANYEAVEPSAGAAVGAAIAARHPKGSIDAVFCVNDGGGVAVARALEAAGRRDVVLATVDGDPAAIAMIRRGGPIAIDTAQFAGPLGAESLRWTYAYMRGQKVPRQVDLTVYPVTRESLAGYPGWMGPIPAHIRRPWPPHAPVPGSRIRW